MPAVNTVSVLGTAKSLEGSSWGAAVPFDDVCFWKDVMMTQRWSYRLSAVDVVLPPSSEHNFDVVVVACCVERTCHVLRIHPSQCLGS